MKASVLPKKNSKKVLITKGLQPLRKTTARSSKRSVLSVLQRTTTRYSKIALKSILISHAFHTTFKALVVMLVTGTALYGAYAFIGNTFDNKVVVSKAEIIARVAKHTTLPAGDPEAVVRVEDAASLKKQNEFYENVKEGDYIIIYPTAAVIYDLRNDTIVALKRKDR